MKLQSVKELENIRACVRLTWNIEGDCLEAGVYTGGSAKEIRTYMNPDKKLYLYDTFEGFKDLQDKEQNIKYLFTEKYSIQYNLINTEVVKGYFPETLIEKPLAFAHLDMDTYESTKKGLDAIYPLMSKGGIILLHDYENPDLFIKEACSGYNVVTLGTSQAYIIK